MLRMDLLYCGVLFRVWMGVLARCPDGGPSCADPWRPWLGTFTSKPQRSSIDAEKEFPLPLSDNVFLGAWGLIRF